jgi:hypothetical protein
VAGRARLPGRQRNARDDPTEGNRLACIGQVALIPDIYHRAGQRAPFDVATLFTDEPLLLLGALANPPPPQQNHALATSRRKPASRANGPIYMALGRVRYPAKRLLQATETGSGRIRAYPAVLSD